MKLGDVLKKERENKGLSAEAMAQRLGVPTKEYLQIEAGESPLERYGPLMMNFAKTVEQPISQLYYPCGIPFQEIEDYDVHRKV